MKKNYLIFSVIFILLMFGCEMYKTKSPMINDTLVNLSDINTPDDDFNAYMVGGYFFESDKIDMTFTMIYSSDRYASGDFDIHKADININQKTKEHLLSDEIEISSNYIGKYNTSFNSTANERGPIMLNSNQNIFQNYQGANGDPVETYYPSRTLVYSFSSDRSGDFDVYYATRETNGVYSGLKKTFFSEPDSNERYGSILNYNADEQYVDGKYIQLTNNEKIVFSSDRSGGQGGYDIYSVKLKDSVSLDTALEKNDSVENVTIIDELSTDADDDYPFTFNNLIDRNSIILFSSNRSGGKGGYDIYYSVYDAEKETFSSPVNFSAVNSAYDEYRPSLYEIRYHDSAGFIYYKNYYILVFSSDRPGGKGKKDLYMYFFTNKSWGN